ncbi:helix-turn-helix transcriptional regulator [Actinomadura bangladeshensis]|uniref:Helix-turn-helix domain-containing protein n=1 Tax=Actinomadura bangladeshensis TaxID=453573 RepID=A0A6L9QBU3_9ACTN|nr:helix-turn-helix transcriptional regulator [Actinomadura bangladeshensis]NEA21568.1 helix-turn-helix domain-containing protein [Actinomadura bangladeshensis]NEA22528.1 helix-turn-helix domain-containing protein [Actinomadura bangladeshensis]
MRALRTRRETRDLSLRFVAPRAGVSAAALGMWERGDRHPTLLSIYTYAAALDAQPVLKPGPDGAAPVPLDGCAPVEDTGAAGPGALPIVRQLRAGRHAREWSSRDLAARIRMSGAAVAAWERGDRHMLLPVARAYAAALGYSLDLAAARPGLAGVVRAARDTTPRRDAA